MTQHSGPIGPAPDAADPTPPPEPPTAVSSSSVPPAAAPPASIPPASAPPASAPPASAPSASVPQASGPPASVPQASGPPASVPPASAPQASIPPPPAASAQPPAGQAPAAANGSRAVRGGAHRTQSGWTRYRDGRRAKKQAKASKPHRKAPWWELPALVILAILIAILVKTFIVQPFYIPSQSMEHTLHGCPGCKGDRILVNKIIYDFRDPHPGDIVVFHAPPGWDNEPTTHPPSNPVLRVIRGFGQLVGVVPPDGQVLVKRVIATGGQTVWGVDDNGRSIVHIRSSNGHERVLHEPYVFNDGSDTHADFGPVTVPKGRIWVMGDHRNDSQDSRFHCLPGGGDGNFGSDCNPSSSTVPIDDVIGKAFVIAWPPSRWRTLGTPSTFDATALAGASDVPGLVSAAVVLPFFVVRHRRRRR